MRFSVAAALFALPFCSAVVKGESGYEKLINLAAAGDGNIKLDEKSFDLLTSANRNWSASIQLTALDKRRRCEPCKEFASSWNSVAKAWSTVPAAERNSHFFATIDFDDGQAVFQKLGIQSAPVVNTYHASKGPRAPASGQFGPYKYDLSDGFAADILAESLSHYTPVAIPYRAPIDWARYSTYAMGGLLLALTLRWSGPLLRSRWTWAAGTVITSLIMNSGYMFTRIRSMPYTGGNGEWIAGGYSNQFGQEVHVIALIYGLLATSFLMLTVVTPMQKSQARQRTQVYLWTAVIMIIFSILVSIFRMKNGGYPFRLML